MAEQNQKSTPQQEQQQSQQGQPSRPGIDPEPNPEGSATPDEGLQEDHRDYSDTGRGNRGPLNK
jgi:hypothetical protein